MGCPNTLISYVNNQSIAWDKGAQCLSTETIFHGTASNDGKKVGLPKYIVTFHIFFLQPGKHIYRQWTKLREGNVFTMMHWTSLHRAPPGPAPRHGTPQPLLPPDISHGTAALSPATNMWWPSLETFSNLFTRGPPLSTGTDICDWSMYGWQAGGKHPPGMLSCFNNRTNAKAIGFMKIQSSGIELNQIWDSRTNTIFLHKTPHFLFLWKHANNDQKEEVLSWWRDGLVRRSLRTLRRILAPEGENLHDNWFNTIVFCIVLHIYRIIGLYHPPEYHATQKFIKKVNET